MFKFLFLSLSLAFTNATFSKSCENENFLISFHISAKTLDLSYVEGHALLSEQDYIVVVEKENEVKKVILRSGLLEDDGAGNNYIYITDRNNPLEFESAFYFDHEVGFSGYYTDSAGTVHKLDGMDECSLYE